MLRNGVSCIGKEVRGVFTSYAAECLALREGLLLAQNCSLRILSMELDSLQAVQAIKNSSLRENVGTIVRDIRELLVIGSGGISSNHISREGNKVAHLLAKYSFSSQSDISSCDVIPLFIRDLVVSDLIT